MLQELNSNICPREFFLPLTLSYADVLLVLTQISVTSKLLT